MHILPIYLKWLNQMRFSNELIWWVSMREWCEIEMDQFYMTQSCEIRKTTDSLGLKMNLLFYLSLISFTWKTIHLNWRNKTFLLFSWKQVVYSNKIRNFCSIFHFFLLTKSQWIFIYKFSSIKKKNNNNFQFDLFDTFFLRFRRALWMALRMKWMCWFIAVNCA